MRRLNPLKTKKLNSIISSLVRSDPPFGRTEVTFVKYKQIIYLGTWSQLPHRKSSVRVHATGNSIDLESDHSIRLLFEAYSPKTAIFLKQ